jgi:hypothetical protein
MSSDIEEYAKVRFLLASFITVHPEEGQAIQIRRVINKWRCSEIIQQSQGLPIRAAKKSD